MIEFISNGRSSIVVRGKKYEGVYNISGIILTVYAERYSIENSKLNRKCWHYFEPRFSPFLYGIAEPSNKRDVEWYHTQYSLPCN